MMLHPYFMLEHVKAHQKDLLEDAERRRILKSARASRRASKAAAAAPQTVQRPLPTALTGTLATCDRHAAGSAR